MPSIQHEFNNKLTIVGLPNCVLYFSYSTLVAFKFSEHDIVIRENEWGPTTGKHLNFIRDDKSIRVDSEQFNKEYAKHAS